jgi:outer membrane protein assembly factor BamB
VSLFPTQPLWTLALNSQLTVPPAYSRSRAFFAIEGDRIVAYDIDTGTQRWLTSAKPRVDLLATEDLLYVVEADRIRALSAMDGSEAWTVPFADKLAARPIVSESRLMFATQEGAVVVLDATNGAAIWRQHVAHAHAPLSAFADRIYLSSSDGRVLALRADNGTIIWTRKLGGAANGALAAGDRVFVGSNDNFFYCLNESDGTVNWRWRTGGDVVGQPVADDDTVYFVSLDNVLRAHLRTTGVQRWLRTLPLRPVGGPLRVGSTIVVAGLAPSVRGYNTSDGQAAGEQTTSGEIAAPLQLADAPTTVFPRMIVVSREIAKGATVLLLQRSREPSAVRAFAPLSNPITTVPKLILSDESFER